MPGWNSGRVCPFKRVAAKLQGLWNAQNMRTVAANQIKEAIGKKLKTPGVTRWNSYYDACVMLLEVLDDQDKRESLNVVMRKQNLPILFDADKALLAQYCKIMKPVACCLDILQGEDKAYMGILLPTLKLMKDQLIALRNDQSIVEGQELINYLLEHPTKRDKAFKGRFEHLFEDKDLLIATALHPQFKLGVVDYLNPQMKDEVKRTILREVLRKITPVEVPGGGDVQPRVVVQNPFKYMRQQAVDATSTQSRLEEDVEKCFDGWDRLQCDDDDDSCNISIVSPDQFPLLHRSAWKELFIKYNTSLPSSAAVERLFSIGSDIFRAKRSALTADNFEALVFLKGNLKLLDDKSFNDNLNTDEDV